MRDCVLPLLACMLLMIAPTTMAGGDWQYRLTPYLWFAGLKGDIATIQGSPAAPIDIPRSEAVDGVVWDSSRLPDV